MIKSGDYIFLNMNAKEYWFDCQMRVNEGDGVDIYEVSNNKFGTLLCSYSKNSFEEAFLEILKEIFKK